MGLFFRGGIRSQILLIFDFEFLTDINLGTGYVVPLLNIRHTAIIFLGNFSQIISGYNNMCCPNWFWRIQEYFLHTAPCKFRRTSKAKERVITMRIAIDSKSYIIVNDLIKTKSSNPLSEWYDNQGNKLPIYFR